MTTIRVTHDGCGDYVLTERDVTVLRYPETNQYQYRFNCASCGHIAIKSAGIIAAKKLLRSGCKTQIIHHMLTEDDMSEGLPISEDEQIEFHEWLESHPDRLVGAPAFQDQLDRQAFLEYRSKQFAEAIEAIPDTLVGDINLQDAWEEVVINRYKTET